ncbi:MAG: spermidine synthase [Deltaproteobacteria bacterium]|nr:spermidine synthase [Deltaproteobacteria bacterium]
MSSDLEELDACETRLGLLSLRRRREPLLGGVEIYEVKLGDEFLMSSLFNAAESALAELGLAGIGEPELDVVVGGLGLGYTTAVALDQPGVRSLLVVEALGEVIDWHRRGLVPLGERLTTDRRLEFVHGDFFELASSEAGFDQNEPGRRFHAVLLDLDHSPRNVLHPRHAKLYRADGLRELATQLHPGGVFALWSNDDPDDEFMRALEAAFVDAEAHVVSFRNPYQLRDSSNTVYVAKNRS